MLFWRGACEGAPNFLGLEMECFWYLVACAVPSVLIVVIGIQMGQVDGDGRLVFGCFLLAVLLVFALFFGVVAFQCIESRW